LVGLDDLRHEGGGREDGCDYADYEDGVHEGILR
jgi:hypothetical protein